MLADLDVLGVEVRKRDARGVLTELDRARSIASLSCDDEELVSSKSRASISSSWSTGLRGEEGS